MLHDFRRLMNKIPVIYLLLQIDNMLDSMLHPLEWKFQRGGVSKTKTFSVGGGGGIWIFFGATNLKDVSHMFVLFHCVLRSPVSGAYDP